MTIQAAGDDLTLALHPRLTVIAGVGPAEREAIIGELVGAIGCTSSGVQLDVVEDSGRRLTISSPDGGSHRVVDRNGPVDVSSEFRRDGEVDVLGQHGLDPASACEALRLDQTGISMDAEEARTPHPIERILIAAGGCIAAVVIAVADPVKNTPFVALVIVALALVLLYQSRLIPLPWRRGHSRSGHATGDPADALTVRLNDLRKLGTSGEAFPLILDEPFVGLDDDVTGGLLELVARRAGDPQIIILTDDDRVASWGRSEARSGGVAVVEPRIEEPQAAEPRSASTA